MVSLYWWEHKSSLVPNGIKRLARFRPPSVRNFGDLLSPLVVSSVTGLPVKRARISDQGKLLAIGSVLFALNDDDIVWGSGFLSSEGDPAIKRATGVRFTAVRGPRTWQVLREHKIECPEIFGDPAILLPLFVREEVKSKGRIGFVPHFSHYPAFRSIGWIKNVQIIDVEKPPMEVVRQIRECDAIFSTSLHGVIVAEAFGIPAQMVVFKRPLHGDIFKFEDYYGSTGRKPSFMEIGRPKDLLSVIKRDPPLPPSGPYSDLLAAFPRGCLAQ